MDLLSLASKACEFEEQMANGLLSEQRDFEASQYRAAASSAKRVLSQLDRENPGLLPLPHDGVAWRDR
jgi:hypothetical protein